MFNSPVLYNGGPRKLAVTISMISWGQKNMKKLKKNGGQYKLSIANHKIHSVIKSHSCDLYRKHKDNVAKSSKMSLK